MKTKRIKPTKVRASLYITKEAQDLMLDHVYASARTMGMFISQLIVDHHARVSRKPNKEEIAAELHRLANLLEEVNPVASKYSEPVRRSNVIDASLR